MLNIKNPLKSKHSHNNRESKEGVVLRFIRESRKLSLVEVASLLNLKTIDVDHFENGRKFYTKEDIGKFLECYNLKIQDFMAIMELKVINKQLVNYYLIQNKL
jgi:transcriptional regulator with XRE-family HTH domain